MKKLDEHTLKMLEQEFRSYQDFKRNMTIIVFEYAIKQEDVNWWVKSRNGHNEKALTDMIKKENDAKYQLNELKYRMIQETLNELPEQLREFADRFLLGNENYMTMSEVAQELGIHKSSAIRKKNKIIEIYAKKIGFLV